MKRRMTLDNKIPFKEYNWSELVSLIEKQVYSYWLRRRYKDKKITAEVIETKKEYEGVLKGVSYSYGEYSLKLRINKEIKLFHFNDITVKELEKDVEIKKYRGIMRFEDLKREFDTKVIKWSLKKWQEMIEKIYGERDKKRSPEEIWLHVVEEAGEIAEALRIEDDRTLIFRLPDLFVWINSFIYSMKLENKDMKVLEDIIWHRFPYRCPYCLKNRGCVCIGLKDFLPEEDRERELEKARKNENERPRNSRGYQKMFYDIYGGVDSVMGINAIGFHLMEEVGEVSRELRLLRRCHTTLEKLQEEIADVLAWYFAVFNKKKLLFDQIMYVKYPKICPYCFKEKCECED